jgi:hypothetical protein
MQRGRDALVARQEAEEHGADNPAPISPIDAPFVAYFQAIERAQVDFEAYHLRLIQEAGSGRPSLTTTTTTTRRPVTLKNGEMARDDNGEILFVEETSTRTTEAVTYSWQASAWLLERTRRDRYSRTVNNVHSGPGGGPIETATAEQQRADLLSEIEAWREREASSSAAEANGAVGP